MRKHCVSLIFIPLLLLNGGCGSEEVVEQSGPVSATVVFADGHEEVLPLDEAFAEDAPEPRPVGVRAIDRRTRESVVITPDEAAQMHPTTGRYVILYHADDARKAGAP